jgi:hypothetical protein
MSMLAKDHSNGGTVEVLRRGSKNWRVRNPSTGVESVRPKAEFSIVDAASSDLSSQRQRIIPTTPLRRIYNLLRKQGGGQVESFEAIRMCLPSRGDEHGSARFLAELCVLSHKYFSLYDNSGEAFVSSKGGRIALHEDAKFARRLLHLLQIGKAVEWSPDTTSFDVIEYEVNPWRTTASYFDDGRSASSSGGGGIDILGRWNNSSDPVVMEIKAITESVGPTFALIQALTYAIELTTLPQWNRLRSVYTKQLGDSFPDNPRVEIALVFEDDFTPDQFGTEDYNFMWNLAKGIVADQRVSAWISRITTWKASLSEEKIWFKRFDDSRDEE